MPRCVKFSTLAAPGSNNETKQGIVYLVAILIPLNIMGPKDDQIGLDVSSEEKKDSSQQTEEDPELKVSPSQELKEVNLDKLEIDTPEKDPNLYDTDILEKLDWSTVTHMKDGVTSQNPGAGFKVRPLRKSDFDKGFLKLLSQLTHVGNITRESFEERFDAMKRCSGHYYVTVIEDVNLGKLVAAATLAVEFKFIRNCSKRGRLEDVVVDDTYRGKQFGKLIVTTITLLAKAVGCYKIGLDCKDSIRFFYRSLGYNGEEGNDRTMIIRF